MHRRYYFRIQSQTRVHPCFSWGPCCQSI